MNLREVLEALFEGKTNGEVIVTLFGEPEKISEKGVLYKFMYRNGKTMFSTFFDYVWWNSPFKPQESEEV